MKRRDKVSKDRNSKDTKHLKSEEVVKSTVSNGDIETGFNASQAGDAAIVEAIIDASDDLDLTRTPTWTRKRNDMLNDADELRRSVVTKHGKHFNFEKKGKGCVGYKLSRHVHQNGQSYDDAAARDYLWSIGRVLNANIQRRSGTTKIPQYIFYGLALLLLTSSTTLDSQVETAVCGSGPNINNHNHTAEALTEALVTYNNCREGFLVKGVYESSIYIGIFLIAHILEFTVAKMNKSSNKLIALYSHFDKVRYKFIEAHKYGRCNIYLKKKNQFLQYITLRFWEGLGFALGYDNPVKFLTSCYKKQSAMVDLNIRIGIYEFFLKLSHNFSEMQRLDAKITGYDGQQLAATIADTLVWRYKNKVERSYIFFMQFKSIIDFQKILYIADAILGFKLFIKEGHVSEASIKRVIMLSSESSSEALSGNGEVDEKKMLKDCKGGGSYISFSQGLKERNNYERAMTLSNPEVVVAGKLEASSRKRRVNKRADKIINDAHSKNSLSSSDSKGDLSEKDMELLCSDKIITQYIMNCASNTFDDHVITQEVLDYIFFKQPGINPTMGEMKRVQAHINHAILNYKLPWNIMYGAYSFTQVLLISLPILSIKDASFIPSFAQWPLNLTAALIMVALEWPKNVMQRDRNLSKANMEHLENNLQHLLSDDWIMISEENRKLKATKSIQYMSFISTCTAYLICKKYNVKVSKFDTKDLVSLVTFILVGLIEYYYQDDFTNFAIQEKEQVKYIIEHLYLNIQSHYSMGINNLRNARYVWRISNVKSLEFDMILNTLKSSIRHSTNSPDLIEIGKLFRTSAEYKALDITGAENFLRIAIKLIRDFKIEHHLKELEDGIQHTIATEMKGYASKIPNRIKRGSMQDYSRFRKKVLKICKEVIGESEALQMETESSIII